MLVHTIASCVTSLTTAKGEINLRFLVENGCQLALWYDHCLVMDHQTTTHMLPDTYKMLSNGQKRY